MNNFQTSSLRVPTNPFARKYVLILHNICKKLVRDSGVSGGGGGAMICHS